ncbi:hypothetical protein LUM37_15425 [Bacillus subtilis]|nr:hypothetical protein LUM37_15425 [Bacillus subtilis]
MNRNTHHSIASLHQDDDLTPKEVTSPPTDSYSIGELVNYIQTNYGLFMPVLSAQPTIHQSIGSFFTVCVGDWNTMISKIGNPRQMADILLTAASTQEVKGYVFGPFNPVLNRRILIHVKISVSDLYSIGCL